MGKEQASTSQRSRDLALWNFKQAHHYLRNARMADAPRVVTRLHWISCAVRCLQQADAALAERSKR